MAERVVQTYCRCCAAPPRRWFWTRFIWSVDSQENH